MSGLRGLQKGFAAALLRGEPAIAERIVSDDAGSAGERLEIYAHAYVARLQEALEVDFPGLLALLGEDFYRATREYIRDNPSHYASVRWYGNRFADWLAAAEPWCQRPELIELARFEWALAAVFDAADEQLATLEQLMAVPPEHWGGMRLHPVAAMQRLDLHYNVAPLREAARNGEPLPELSGDDQPVAWLVWRKGLDPHWRSLEVDEAWALDRCAEGADFAAICAGLCEWVDEANAPLRAVGFLQQWLGDELLSRIEPATPS